MASSANSTIIVTKAIETDTLQKGRKKPFSSGTILSPNNGTASINQFSGSRNQPASDIRTGAVPNGTINADLAKRQHDEFISCVIGSEWTGGFYGNVTISITSNVVTVDGSTNEYDIVVGQKILIKDGNTYSEVLTVDSISADFSTFTVSGVVADISNKEVLLMSGEFGVESTDFASDDYILFGKTLTMPSGQDMALFHIGDNLFIEDSFTIIESITGEVITLKDDMSAKTTGSLFICSGRTSPTNSQRDLNIEQGFVGVTGKPFYSYKGLRVDTMAMSLAPASVSTISFNLLGRLVPEGQATSEYTTAKSPLDETPTTANKGFFIYDGQTVGSSSSITVNVSNGNSQTQAVFVDGVTGIDEGTLSFSIDTTIYKESTRLYEIFRADTKHKLEMFVQFPSGGYTFLIENARISSDSTELGDPQITESITFVADSNTGANAYEIWRQN